ncbi:coproporphyrinogen III oxidase [Nonlabens sp. MIC269]|uniref:radical SAM family heme chaperone HemW n=1 Tax=Nonlabens sp. MIC269 TaxID=1476901 RepID=UPI00071EA43C|nr:radical SAM family heme chaperone HemW [Nonlabens sp. MIC269]ALM21198.1 coproporphyrinogen III oxidase [Nonlabens sp. MIC269]
MSGIYIHIPFCKQACHYCDFHFVTSTKYKTRMIQALCDELRFRAKRPNIESNILNTDINNSSVYLDDDAVVETIYFGGGTPSVLQTEEINKIIDTVYQNFNVSSNPEITLEANPDDLDDLTIKKLEKSLVNRLSIGVQSFHEKDLKLMNRAHNAQQAEECILKAQQYFENLSIDLIYGIPGLTNEEWRDNIYRAIELKIPHISSYALTVEDNTALKSYIEKGLIPQVDDEKAHEHFNILIDAMQLHGYKNYEFSNFGKPGFFSRNNTAYWTGKPYLGIGPSAHSFDGEKRGWNINNNLKFMKAIENGNSPMEIEKLTKVDRYNEYIMTGLRTIYGVSLEKIETEYGLEFKTYLLKQAQEYLKDHLLYLDGDTLLVTRKGKFLSDGIASELFMLNLGDYKE